MPISEQPQLNKQHPVPQNIMDVEFKLIGDLTMRQFAYLFVFGLSAYMAYLLVIGIFKWPAVATLVFLGLGLAFVPVEERGLDEWFVNFIKVINFPTQRVWGKEPTIPTPFLQDNIDVVRQEMITLAPTSSRRKLEYYLDRQKEKEKVDPLDIPEREYIMKVREAFPPAPTRPKVGVSVIEPPTPVLEEEQERPSEEPKGTREEVVKVKSVPKRSEVDLPAQAGEKQPEAVVRKPLIIKKPQAVSRRVDFEFEPITPDTHTGRKFVNLLPSKGELVLPIRGERVLKTSEQIESEEDVTEKAKKLQQLLQRIRQEEGIEVVRREAKKQIEVEVKQDLPAIAEQREAKVGVKQEIKDIVSKLREQNKKLTQEISELKKQIGEAKSESKETVGQEQLLKKLEEEKQRIASSYMELSNRVKDLQQKLGERTTVSTGPETRERLRRGVRVLTNKPNVVSGVVRDVEGASLEDILLIVKNKKEEAVRALKTGSMGQFILSTPLDDGVYTIEVSPANRISLTFDIIPIEVKGNVIPPIEIVGK